MVKSLFSYCLTHKLVYTENQNCYQPLFLIKLSNTKDNLGGMYKRLVYFVTETGHLGIWETENPVFWKSY